MKYQELAKHFYDYFLDQDKRNSFYRTVIKESERRSRASQKESSDALQSVVGDLAMCCSDWTATGLCPIIMSMDKVHVLFETRALDTQSSYTLYSW
jgi:hypothetical protein